MIVNVISSGITESTSNVFAGMSLAEACGQLQANVSDALNEMNMSILLNEHLYLRENGEDISYLNEGKLTDLKNKITGAIDKVISQVSQLWDRLITWVQDRVEDVRMAFARAKVNKEKAKLACNQTIDGVQIKFITDNQIQELIRKITVDETSTNYDNMATGKDKNFDFDSWVIPMTKLTAGDLDKAYRNVFETEHTTIGDIKSAKKKSIDYLNSKKKEIKKANDSDKADVLKSINAASRRVSKYSSIAVKAYHLNIDSSVKMLQAAVKKYNKDNSDTKKQDAADKKQQKFVNKYSESAIFSDDRFFKA